MIQNEYALQIIACYLSTPNPNPNPKNISLRVTVTLKLKCIK